jgi:hypothetical protein
MVLRQRHALHLRKKATGFMRFKQFKKTQIVPKASPIQGFRGLKMRVKE